MTAIMTLIQIALGLGFIIIGILMIFIDKICNEKIKAVYSPDKATGAFVFTRNNKEITTYPMSLCPKKDPIKRGEQYEVYICKSFPKLLIFSKEIHKVQYLIAGTAIFLGLTFAIAAIYANFFLL